MRLQMSEDRFKRIAIKLKGYVKENWGAPFIVGFMLLMVNSAVFLSVGLSYVANTIAVHAYYALVVGILLQVICFLKYGRKPSEVEVI
jgi:amino acid transporter